MWHAGQPTDGAHREVPDVLTRVSIDTSPQSVQKAGAWPV
jgi:hypothetical protein